MLLNRDQSALIVVDYQERLAPAMHDLEATLARAMTLIETAHRLDVPVLLTEQYPKGLGPSVAPLATMVAADCRVEKIEFSAAANSGFRRRLEALDRQEVVVCGIEAHVCVLQTVLELSHQGYRAILVRDACTSRRTVDAEAAFARAAVAGVEVVTTEMVAFEWLRHAGTDEFRAVSRLIK